MPFSYAFEVFMYFIYLGIIKVHIKEIEVSIHDYCIIDLFLEAIRHKYLTNL